MNHKELFENIIDGKPPKVESLKPIKNATSNIGAVTAVKWRSDGSYRGIEVSFPGLNYNLWFWESVEKKDGRSRYMDELIIHVP